MSVQPSARTFHKTVVHEADGMSHPGWLWFPTRGLDPLNPLVSHHFPVKMAKKMGDIHFPLYTEHIPTH